MIIKRGKVLVKAYPGKIHEIIAGGILLAVGVEEVHHRKMIGFQFLRQVRVELVGQTIRWRQ